MSVSRSNARQNQSPAQTLIKRLRAGEGALLQRNGHWHLLSPASEGERRLPAKSSAVIHSLIAAGALVAGEDGLFRPVAAAARAVRNAAESPLGRLWSCHAGEARFEPDLMKAADRLRLDYERAHLAPRLTTNYDPSRVAGSSHWQMSDNGLARLSDDAIAARQRVHRALEAVGPELSGLLLQVCCLITGLEEAERQLDLPRRSARAILLLALTRLARHYGLRPQLRHAGPSRIGHWAVADFRPSIQTRNAGAAEGPSQAC